MAFHPCKNFVLRNLNVKNSQQIHVSIEKCSNVKVSNLTITAPSSSPNTDGIHVMSTTKIKITNCTIMTGDDCISIKTGTKNLKATKIICGPGHGISVGSLGYNNSEARVSGILIDRVMMNGTMNGARIKTWQGGRGYVKNIVFQNILMHKRSAVQVSNVIYRNIKGTIASDAAIKLDCSASFPCNGIAFEGIKLVGKKGKLAKSTCQNAKWSESGTVVPTPCSYKSRRDEYRNGVYHRRRKPNKERT